MNKLASGGNSFAIYSDETLNEFLNIVQIVNQANRVSTDGMVLIKAINGGTCYKLSFYNNDGRAIKMCFNGTLCAVMYLFKAFQIAPKLLLMPDRSKFQVGVHNQKISLKFNAPHVVYNAEKLSIAKFEGICYYIPYADDHKVYIMNNDCFFNSHNFLTAAKLLREQDRVFPKGANVHFVYILNENVYIRHFEKGIEKETLSCGSGCIATAIILENNQYLKFFSPGGILEIYKKNSKQWEMVGLPNFLK